MISKKIAKKMQNMVLQILWALGRLLNGNIRPNWIDSSLWEISFFSSIAMTASLRSDNPAGQSIDVFSNSFDFMMSIVEINIIVYVYRPSMKRHLLLRLFISFFVVVLFFIFIIFFFLFLLSPLLSCRWGEGRRGRWGEWGHFHRHCCNTNLIYTLATTTTYFYL